jgi:hypothetical protein
MRIRLSGIPNSHKMIGIADSSLIEQRSQRAVRSAPNGPARQPDAYQGAIAKPPARTAAQETAEDVPSSTTEPVVIGVTISASSKENIPTRLAASRTGSCSRLAEINGRSGTSRTTGKVPRASPVGSHG